uniref:Small ribosomal subunit protein uS3c n=1 Tax=Codium simulans TaxID=589376 RepID=A0A1I9LKK4_9CHLO|nr:30S ribosomal protein S3 [Codium simulans]ANJ70865.1 30S ribosomal protein S3 [Codium simulans]
MAQKIHPYAFRLGVIHKHHANWFADKKNYSAYFFEDLYIREFVEQQLPNTGILKVHITRQPFNYIHVSLFCIKTNYFLTPGKKNLKTIQTKLKTLVANYQISSKMVLNFPTKINQYNQPLRLSVQLIEHPNYEQNAFFLAKFLIDQLEKRIAFRRAVKKTLKRFKKEAIYGIKIQISGRINGAEIARTEWVRKGQVPLQTLAANIDYTFRTAKTIYGILGIKIWIFQKK